MNDKIVNNTSKSQDYKMFNWYGKIIITAYYI